LSHRVYLGFLELCLFAWALAVLRRLIDMNTKPGI
jgi:hypothetical protein